MGYPFVKECVIFFMFARIAQLAERHPRKVQVMGSTPISGLFAPISGAFSILLQDEERQTEAQSTENDSEEKTPSGSNGRENLRKRPEHKA